MRKPTLRQGVLVLASVLIVTLILGPLVLVWCALYTTGGAQFIVRHLPRQIGGVQLQISGLSGTVAQGLHVERVEIDQELVHLKFEDIDARVTLAPGESARVAFSLHADRTAFTGRDGTRIVEPGEISVAVGGASDDLPLSASFTLTGPVRAAGADRVLTTPVSVWLPTGLVQ